MYILVYHINLIPAVAGTELCWLQHLLTQSLLRSSI